MLTTDTPEEAQAKVVAWIEREIGPVRSIARQGRWRPAWFVDAEKDGRLVALYVRGDRGGRWPPSPLSYEAKVLALLADQGVKVAPLYGYIEDVPAIVMGRVPGGPNMANAASDGDRERLREQLADQMRKIHEIDPALLEAAGSPSAGAPQDVALRHYRHVEQLYLDGDRRPSPDIEFVRGWLNRNTPPCPEGPAVITVDAGQFIFAGDELTAMMDFELTCLGDRHVDMAALRTRDRFERIGDLESFYDLYEQRGGQKLDRQRIRFQFVPFAMYTVLQVADELAHPERAPEYFEYFMWHAGCMQDALQDIAALTHLELEPYELPTPEADQSSMTLQALGRLVEAMPTPDDLGVFRKYSLDVTIKYLGDFEARRTALEREYLDDIEALTGRRPANAWAGDVQMEAFVQAAGPELDEALLRFLYRRNQRVMAIVSQHRWKGFKRA